MSAVPSLLRSPRVTMTMMDTAFLLSDVDFVRWARAEHRCAPDVVERAERELEFYRFTESDEAYRAHYELHEGKFYDGPVAPFLVGDWSKDPRIAKLLDVLARTLDQQSESVGPNIARVLDYGCASGHVTRVMARRFSNVNFVGYDYVARGVELTGSLGPSNVTAVWDDYLSKESTFDVVVAAEVLEHVRDPYTVIDRFFGELLRPGGALVVTMPSGPWEAQGYDANPGAREHLRHWGPVEMREVFGPKALVEYQFVGMSRFGVPIGNVFVVARERAGVVDMERKLRDYQNLVDVESERSRAWRFDVP